MNLLGDLGGDVYGLRVSRPGYNVLTEPLGSKGISFDSRLVDFGIVHAQGAAFLNTPVSFPALPYVPLATIHRIGGSLIYTEDVVRTNIGNAVHFATPYVALVSTSSLVVIPQSVPFYGIAFPGGMFMYTVYAIET